MTKSKGLVWVIAGSLLFFGVVGLMMNGFGRAQDDTPSIAFINVDQVWQYHPMLEEAIMALQMEEMMLYQEHEEKMEELSEEEANNLEMEIYSKMEELQNYWIMKIEGSIMDAIEEVADSEGYDIVLVENIDQFPVVLYGGANITETVISLLSEGEDESSDLLELDLEDAL